MPLNDSITALLILNGNSRSGADANIQEGIELLENAGIRIIQKNPVAAQKPPSLLKIIATKFN
jgi:diacylglycerol kinase (ATP)